MNRLRNRGIPLLSALVLFLPIIVLIPREIAEAVFIPGLAFSFFVSMIGVFLLTKGLIWKNYIYGIKVLQRISPPDPIVTAEYAVTKRDNTYIFILQSVPGALYFVAFKHPNATSAEKIDVPKTFWKWNSALRIEGLKAHDRKGFFSIPTPERTISCGDGLLLAVPILGSSYILRVPDFSRNRLLAVAKYVSSLTSDGTSFDKI
jgi:hypothetical protein